MREHMLEYWDWLLGPANFTENGDCMHSKCWNKGCLAAGTGCLDWLLGLANVTENGNCMDSKRWNMGAGCWDC